MATRKFISLLNLSKRFVCFENSVKCWKCGVERRMTSELFCEQCHFIQNPIEKNNYFRIFELDESFRIDNRLLTKKYREMQSVLHPDKFTNKSEQEKQISEEFSSLVNKAYNTLQLPLKRAVHLLNLKGEKIDENAQIVDQEFLMEIMELNEKVENADTPEKLQKLDKDNRKKLEEIGTEIDNSFGNGDLEKAKEWIIRMKYYNSLGNYINSLLRERGIVE